MLVRPGKGLPIESKVLRPIIIGLAIVIDLKCFKSSGKYHGSELSTPITPFLLTATINEILIIYALLNSNRGRYRFVRHIILQFEVFKHEIK